MEIQLYIDSQTGHLRPNITQEYAENVVYRGPGHGFHNRSFFDRPINPKSNLNNHSTQVREQYRRDRLAMDNARRQVHPVGHVLKGHHIFKTLDELGLSDA